MDLKVEPHDLRSFLFQSLSVINIMFLFYYNIHFCSHLIAYSESISFVTFLLLHELFCYIKLIVLFAQCWIVWSPLVSSVRFFVINFLIRFLYI